MTSLFTRTLVRRFEPLTSQLRMSSTTSETSSETQTSSASAAQPSQILPHKIDEKPKEDMSQIFQVKNSEVEKFRGSNFQFPCLNRRFAQGPEPDYENTIDGYQIFTHKEPFHLLYNDGILPQIDMAYETWGKLNEEKDNALLLFTGLSASSHACSHKENTKPGWWEKFIGSGKVLDTDKFFIICANQLGGCYGSTGPSSTNPLTQEKYGTHFPMLSIKDMVSAQALLVQNLGIKKLYAAVGSSLGGMCSVAMAALYPDMVARMISISACTQSHPSTIALRYLQRRCIMEDPNWNRGHYYGLNYPIRGMKLAREIATLTYRSGAEWESRFGRTRVDGETPSLCHNFQIEQYIEYQGLQFATKYDPNSLLYISKAMDLYDLNDYFQDGNASSRISCPSLVMGANTDLLFPIQQQQQMAQNIKRAGNKSVTFYELNSIYGHDTFLLDISSVGTAVKGFLETEISTK